MGHMGSMLLLETLQDELKIFNKIGKKRWKKEGIRKGANPGTEDPCNKSNT